MRRVVIKCVDCFASDWTDCYDWRASYNDALSLFHVIWAASKYKLNVIPPIFVTVMYVSR